MELSRRVKMKNVVCYNSVLQSPAEPGAVCCIVGQRMAPFSPSSNTLALVMASLLPSKVTEKNNAKCFFFK